MNGITSLIWSAACFMLVIGPLIFIHELGHYFVGRWCGVKAEAFSIGFGREVFGWTDRRGTRWKVSWMPLGGYVRFAGDMGPASAPTAEWLALPAAKRAMTFQAKAVWQRFLIVLAGPLVNMIFAFVIIAGLLAFYGEPVTPPIVAHIQPGSGAAAAGLVPGDRITAVGGRPVRRFEDVQEFVVDRPAGAMTIDFVRAGKPLSVLAHSHDVSGIDPFGNPEHHGMLGIGPGERVIEPVALIELPARAAGDLVDVLQNTVGGLKQIIRGDRSIKELHGPVGTASVAGKAVSLGWFWIIVLMASISVNLGFINLLPIPMLDGGHLLFYAIEAVRRKPMEPAVQEWAFRSGFAFVLGLMLFVTFNDLGSAGVWARLAGLIG
jgi:regulator of sigma E protease